MWNLCGISLAVHDIALAEHFYKNVLALGAPKIRTEIECVFASSRSFIRLKKPSNKLIRNEEGILTSVLNRYVMIEIPDLRKAKTSLVKTGANFQQIKSLQGDGACLCIALPCQNIMIVCEASSKIFEEDIEQVTLKKWKLHHVNLQAADVRKSVEFLAMNLGLREGSWKAPKEKGDFSIEPKDLSVFPLGAFNGGLHIIKPDPGFALRNNFAHNPSIGGHPAVAVQDIQVVKNRLEQEDIQVTDAGTYAMRNMHQIYCLDPSGNVIEINQYIPD